MLPTGSLEEKLWHQQMLLPRPLSSRDSGSASSASLRNLGPALRSFTSLFSPSERAPATEGICDEATPVCFGSGSHRVCQAGYPVTERTLHSPTRSEQSPMWVLGFRCLLRCLPGASGLKLCQHPCRCLRNGRRL